VEWSSGGAETLGVLAGEPTVVVDLDRPDAAARLQVPALLGCVVIGVSRTGEAAAAPAADVLVSGRRGAPRPWVGVADVDAEIDRLRAAIEATPVAATVAAQVLRAGRPDDPDHDLVVESLAYSTLQGGAEFSRWRKSAARHERRAGSEPPVLLERQGGGLVITLNRPEVHNAYNAAMRDGLCEALSLAMADPGVEAVHLRGAGRSFCSGGDLDEFGSAPDPATAHLIRTCRSPARLLASMAGAASGPDASRASVTVHLHGACAGSGIELPAWAHRVLAAPDTQIWLPEVGMGLIPGAGGTASIPRRIGRQRTAWLALSGLPIDGLTALEWGLVDAVQPI